MFHCKRSTGAVSARSLLRSADSLDLPKPLLAAWKSTEEHVLAKTALCYRGLALGHRGYLAHRWRGFIYKLSASHREELERTWGT